MALSKLTHISFNGIDSKTNIDELVEIQNQYPLAEFGIILSKNWFENGNRYVNPKELYKYKDKGLNLSAHLCGAIAREAHKGNMQPTLDLCGDDFSIFSRMQLNIARNPGEASNIIKLQIPNNIKQVIVQQKSVDECEFFKELYTLDDTHKFVMLLDISGGLGIEGDIKVIHNLGEIGYAGGVNEENILSKIKMFDNEDVTYWIDMESGVRTDDWFDTNKVKNVCKLIYDYLKL